MKLPKLFRNPYFLIIVTYVLAHSFLLFLSGCWWDDWTFMTHNTDYIAIVAADSGRPEWNLLVPLCWSLPNNGRILIYFLYLLICLFVYRILKESTLFSEEDSLAITLLFSTVPVNEARLLISNFAYTVGLFLFYLAFLLFIRWNKSRPGTRKTVCRILLLILFYVSFILNSILVFYYILIAYLFILKLKTSSESRWFRKILLAIRDVLVQYPDFFVLPFVNYVLHKLLHPVSGVFVSRNVVSLEGLWNGLNCIPWSVIKVFEVICRQFMDCIGLPLCVALLIVIGLILLSRKQLEDHSWIDALRYLIYGSLILVLAIFPYVVVRMELIETIGVKGRDAVLIPLGFALIVYACMSLIKGRYRTLLLGIVLVFSIFSCNDLYLEWQKDYYAQLVLEEKLDDPLIAANDTFFLTDLHETKVEGQRYYSLNANAYNVYKETTRLFLPKASNLHLLMNEEAMEQARTMLDHAYMFEDYEPEDYCLDAVLDFDCELTDGETWKLKYKELFDPDGFRETIGQTGALTIYPVEDDFTVILLDAYQKNLLHEDKDILELLYDYMK